MGFILLILCFLFFFLFLSLSLSHTHTHIHTHTQAHKLPRQTLPSTSLTLSLSSFLVSLIFPSLTTLYLSPSLYPPFSSISSVSLSHLYRLLFISKSISSLSCLLFSVVFSLLLYLHLRLFIFSLYPFSFSALSPPLKLYSVPTTPPNVSQHQLPLLPHMWLSFSNHVSSCSTLTGNFFHSFKSYS